MERRVDLGSFNPRGVSVWWARAIIPWRWAHYRYSKVFQLHRLTIGKLCIDWRIRWTARK